MKRAQAAMEFLMTYGWAILVVLAAIGALAYFGVLSPGNLLPHKCEFSQGLECTEQPSASAAAGTITFPITNSLGYRIHITAGTSDDEDGNPDCTGVQDDAGNAVPLTIANGDSVVLVMTGCALTEGDRFKDDVVFAYTSNATGMVHTGTGQVTGKVGP